MEHELKTVNFVFKCNQKISKNRDDIEERYRTINMEMDHITSNLEALKYNKRQTTEAINLMKRQKNEKLSAFGHSMHLVVRDIEQAEREGRWRGRKPVGPIGELNEQIYNQASMCLFLIRDMREW